VSANPQVLRVWAPAARRVDVFVDEDTVPMTLEPFGWWRAEVPSAKPGSDYGFSLDGGAVLPDPRSPWQPRGVHGRSRLVDHSAFPWTDDGWRGLHLPSAVLYELHVGTFTPEGTFDAVVARLDHLVDLGVTAVELLPVAEFPGTRGWGYDGVALYAPYSGYGGPEGLKRLVDACHARGLGVVIDVVYNHLGPDGNHLPNFGPYFSDKYRTNWGSAVNFDGPGSDAVRDFVVDNALMWLRDYHADGLRLDAVHAIKDESAVHVLEQLASAVRELSAHVGRPLFLIAESDLNDPRFVRSPELGGYGLDAAWADEWHHALHAVLTGENTGYYEDFGSVTLLAKALRQAWVYDGTFSPHRMRSHGRPPTGLTGHQFTVCTQNHDQVGNRALGERSSGLMPESRLRVAGALLLMSPFLPLLFQGEEWGASTPFQYFTDHQDPELGRAVSEGRRREFASFGWDPADVPDPQDPATFQRSRLDWSEPEREPHAGLLDWYRRLIRLRRDWPELTDGRLDLVQTGWDEERSCLAVRRGNLAVACNLSGEVQAVPLWADAAVEVLLASTDEIEATPSGVALPPDSVAILHVS
jgi:maltooligosyltrehalose trehalohydrolase